MQINFHSNCQVPLPLPCNFNHLALNVSRDLINTHQLQGVVLLPGMDLDWILDRFFYCIACCECRLQSGLIQYLIMSRALAASYIVYSYGACDCASNSKRLGLKNSYTRAVPGCCGPRPNHVHRCSSENADLIIHNNKLCA